MLTPADTPIQEADLSTFGLPPGSLFVKREDLSHPHFGGNKLRKLRFNLLKAKQMGQDTILTFGGPWSNHIYSTAAACKECGLRSIGVIRGERPSRLSDTLDFAEKCGMQLVFLSRAEYREKETDYFKAWLRDEYGRFYLIPEGGSNYLGVQGCTEILDADTRRFDHLLLAMGTGATAAGMVLSCREGQTVHGIPVINQGEGLQEALQGFLYGALMDVSAVEAIKERFRIHPGFQGSGFAKWDLNLLAFMRDVYLQTGIKLDQVYTAKAMQAAIHLIREGIIDKPLLVVHTGGLQGIRGLERKLGEAVYQ